MSGRSNVLIADDDEAVRLLLVSALREQLGVRASAAANGQAALDAVALIDPTVLLLDIGMPSIDGLEVARRLRASPRTRSIPILAISGRPLREEAIAAGCDDFFAKPFKLAEVLAWVEERLG